MPLAPGCGRSESDPLWKWKCVVVTAWTNIRFEQWSVLACHWQPFLSLLLVNVQVTWTERRILFWLYSPHAGNTQECYRSFQCHLSGPCVHLLMSEQKRTFAKESINTWKFKVTHPLWMSLVLWNGDWRIMGFNAIKVERILGPAWDHTAKLHPFHGVFKMCQSNHPSKYYSCPNCKGCSTVISVVCISAT